MLILDFKRISTLCFVILMICGPNGFSQTRRRNKEATPQQRRPFEQLARRYLSDRRGRVRMDLWAAGMDYVNKMQRSRWTLPVVAQPRNSPVTFRGGPTAAPTPLQGNIWYPQGPAPIRDIFSPVTIDSGEVVGIAIDPRGEMDNVIYIATGLGGIWKTTNGGGQWFPKTDHMPSMSMGAVALDVANPDIVYAGTGNPYESTSISVEAGNRIKAIGVYRSEDGGNNWILKGRDIFGPTQQRSWGLGIYKILSTVPNGILVATSGGLFYSPNGGNTFGSNVPAFNNGQPLLAGNIRDLARDTTQSNIVYATVTGQGILRSLDYGLTFPLNLFKTRSGAAKPSTPVSFDALWMSQSRLPNNRTIYASVIGSNGSYAGLYKSSDGGGTWRMFSALNGVALNTTPSYAVTIGVDPTDSERVYTGFVGLFRSTDGGSSFSSVGDGFVHADHHAIAFSPPSRTRRLVYVGTDGGIYASADSGNRWTVDLNRTISSNLIIDFAMDRTNPQYMYAGIWDHGVVSRRPGDVGTSWWRGDFGDGANVAIDPLDPTVCYHSSGMMGGGPAFIRTTNGGQHWEGVAGLDWVPNRLFFLSVMSAEGWVSSELYAARGSQLYRLNISSGTSAVTSTLITTLDGNINRLSYSEARPEAVWVTTETGTIWRTNNLNAPSSPWLAANSPSSIGPAVIAVSPMDPEKAYVVYAGFSDPAAGSPSGHVYYTDNGGRNWTDITGVSARGTFTALPDLPVYDIVLIANPSTPLYPPKVVVASEAGVMINEGTLSSPNWMLLGDGLPKSACNRLQYARGLSVLAVSTWGRGVFKYGGTD